MNSILNKFTGDAEVEILIDEKMKKAKFRNKTGQDVAQPTFSDKDNVVGKVIITLLNTRKLEHIGIRIDLIGQIEITAEKKVTSNFIALTRDLEPPGILNKDTTTFDFNFNNVEKQYETFRGKQVSVKYFLRLTIAKKIGNIVKEVEFYVVNPVDIELEKKVVKNEVGIEDWLHLGFEFDKNQYNLKDVVKGTVVFKKVSIRLKKMELQIIKRETIGAGTSAVSDNEIVTKYEIMDGGPIKNETIPIKFYLTPYELSPTFINVNNKFSIQYFLNLVLIDVEERKYFKQHEIIMNRLVKKKTKNV